MSAVLGAAHAFIRQNVPGIAILKGKMTHGDFVRDRQKIPVQTGIMRPEGIIHIGQEKRIRMYRFQVVINAPGNNVPGLTAVGGFHQVAAAEREGARQVTHLRVRKIDGIQVGQTGHVGHFRPGLAAVQRPAYFPARTHTPALHDIDKIDLPDTAVPVARIILRKYGRPVRAAVYSTEYGVNNTRSYAYRYPLLAVKKMQIVDSHAIDRLIGIVDQRNRYPGLAAVDTFQKHVRTSGIHGISIDHFHRIQGCICAGRYLRPLRVEGKGKQTKRTY